MIYIIFNYIKFFIYFLYVPFINFLFNRIKLFSKESFNSIFFNVSSGNNKSFLIILNTFLILLSELKLF